MQRTDFSAKITSDGYMLFYHSFAIGGAGVRTADRDPRRRRTAKIKQADIRMYKECVERTIDELIAGRGQAYYRKAIGKIDEINSRVM